MKPRTRRWVAYGAVGLSLAFGGVKSYAELQEPTATAAGTSQQTTTQQDAPAKTYSEIRDALEKEAESQKPATVQQSPKPRRTLEGKAEKPIEIPEGTGLREAQEITRSYKSTVNRVRGMSPNP